MSDRLHTHPNFAHLRDMVRIGSDTGIVTGVQFVSPDAPDLLPFRAEHLPSRPGSVVEDQSSLPPTIARKSDSVLASLTGALVGFMKGTRISQTEE